MKSIINGILFLFLSASAAGAADCELVVYCGMTMVKPMAMIAAKFEEQEKCSVRIAKGSTSELMSRILSNKNGDLFLPGSDAYYLQLEKEHPGLIIDKRFVGYNRAALLVRKGNPKNIPADLAVLTKPEYNVIMGHPDGHIGAESKKILEAKGIYAEVMKNAKAQTTEAHALMNALMHKKADVTIGWRAVAFWPENREHVDALPIDEKYAKKEKLVLSTLNFSKYPDKARKLLELAGSAEGLAVFNGLGYGE